MTNFKKFALGALSAALLAAAAAAPASAATTHGDSAVVTDNGTTCAGGSLFSSHSVPYQVSSGVLTSFSTRRGTAGGAFSLKLMRGDVLTSLTVVGSSQVVTATDGLNTYPARIRVTAGDRLAIWSANTQLCLYTEALAPHVQIAAASDPPVGTQYNVLSPSSGARLSLSAVVEPDADNDGFGDESQDGCPANPARQAAPCITPAPCKVPSLKGKTKSAAKSALEKANCKLGSTKKKKLKKFTKKQKRNRVRTQSVKSGTTLANGASVNITINTKKK